MYWVVKKICEDKDNGSYTSYGVATEGYYIGDISIDCECVNKLVHLCNTLELSKVHFMDAVEDWVAGL
ncbi:DUF6514 family protein [Hydrogenoanaerobacterium sp.]|uniref:DUF6514 family protein n=1 Tax=Hydrogenoanaerobacterium sp. TaxID=2953763 RepID=UPI00289D6F05|nr:hypothetical protein [Hydrogenoanaerobacterium sp.]